MPFLHKNKNANNVNNNSNNINNLNYPYTNATLIPVNQAAPMAYVQPVQQSSGVYSASSASQSTLNSEWNPQPPVAAMPSSQGIVTNMPITTSNTTAPVVIPERTVVVGNRADPAQVHRHHHHHHHHSGNHSNARHSHHHSSHRGNDDRHHHHHHHHHHERRADAVILNNAAMSTMPNNQSGVLASSATNAPIEETIMKPVIVEEIVRNDTITEVQPVITRHVEQTFVNHIEKHIYETAAPLGVSTVTSAPIVNEVIHPHYIDEITEIIHREVPVVQVEHVQQFSEEAMVLPATHTHETRVLGTDFTQQNLGSSQDNSLRLSKDLERMNLGMGQQQGMQAGATGSAQL